MLMMACPQKLGARLASPQPRPASPVNGAGGITGCWDDSRRKRTFRTVVIFFKIFNVRDGETTKPLAFVRR
jgi:hypothetical protein